MCTVQHAMEAMVAVAVLVNCALIGLSGPVHRLLPDASPAQTVLVIVALEVRGGGVRQDGPCSTF